MLKLGVLRNNSQLKIKNPHLFFFILGFRFNSGRKKFLIASIFLITKRKVLLIKLINLEFNINLLVINLSIDLTSIFNKGIIFTC